MNELESLEKKIELATKLLQEAKASVEKFSSEPTHSLMLETEFKSLISSLKRNIEAKSNESNFSSVKNDDILEIISQLEEEYFSPDNGWSSSNCY